MPDNAWDRDVSILRGLAEAYMGVAALPIQEDRRRLWRSHNALERGRVPVYLRWFDAWHELPESRLGCTDPFLRGYEEHFRQLLYQHTLGDDCIIEPFVVLRSRHVLPSGGHWGMSPGWHDAGEGAGGRGARRWDPPIKEPEDVEGLAVPFHLIDEDATAKDLERLTKAIGGIVPIALSRAPYYRTWTGDISTDLAYLRGLEQVMWDMVDRPEWLHSLLARMRDGILAVHDRAEEAGDWRICDHYNQSMAYAEGMADPGTDASPVGRGSLWAFMAAQELTLVSPGMHWEFMLEYQIPILSRFGLVAYGCCEDLTRRIPYLRRITNLRRIAVAPSADVRACAGAIGSDYVMSWRPNPAEMVCCGFDADHVRRVVADAMDACRDGVVDVCLKDVTTIQGDPSRLREFVRIVREVTEG